ncbi:MAG: hypothetical protein A2Y76_15615 [Planctomycetes bacterium RBG_13_60_9]|nr:MAG: hypothetical protein A2Y76_15615 [Planctomycetes bacterium RBG_13_60_9]
MTEKAVHEMIGIRTAVLIGRQDFGRCPTAARLPAALWPIAGKSVLERLLRHLAEEGIVEGALCCGDDISALVGDVPRDARLAARVVTEELSRGTAGCLRDAVAEDAGDVILVCSGGIACPPSIGGLMEAHTASGADLTVVFNPGRSDQSPYGTAAEMYVCRPSVLAFIPAEGYCDIKEGLIPILLRAGGVVKPHLLAHDVGNFHDQAGYLRAVSVYLRSGTVAGNGYSLCERSDRRLVATAPGASIHPQARIYGPVAIAADASVAGDAVIVGPAILDHGVRVGEHSVVVESVLWDGATVGARCEVRRSLIEHGARVAGGSIVVEQAVPARRQAKFAMVVRAATEGVGDRLGRLRGRLRGSFRVVERLLARAPLPPRQCGYVAGGVIVLAAFLWSYWATFTELWSIWWRSDEYSAGLLVPPLAGYVLWTRRQELASTLVRPAILCGIAAFATAQVIRGLGLYLLYSSAEMLSIILTLSALIMLLLGWRVLRKMAPIVLFLCLMLPWPHRIQTRITLPLQRWATDSAVFCLEVIGYQVMRDGNVIGIGETNVAVAEACNGLRMVTAFLVISALVVLLVKRAWWEKLIVLVSSLPIALLCNTLRLTVTAMFFTVLKGDSVKELFHDFGGYAMMPVALALVVGEFWLLRQLVTPRTRVQPVIIARRESRHAMDS